MSAIVFPTSPTVGQVFTAAGRSWIWTGAVWNINSSIAAANIANAPAGGISATDVQGAINELDAEKLDKAGGTASGNITLNGTSNTAPNQTAASGSSIMTLDLTDVRYGSATIVRLTSDFIVNNNAVEQVVTGWAQANLALAASSTYIIDGMVNITATAGGWRVQSYWDYGVGGIGTHSSSYWNANAATASNINDSRNAANVASAFASSGTIGGVRFNWMIRTGTGSPYLEIKFRQNTADLSNTSIKAGSFIIIRKLQ